MQTQSLELSTSSYLMQSVYSSDVESLRKCESLNISFASDQPTHRGPPRSAELGFIDIEKCMSKKSFSTADPNSPLEPSRPVGSLEFFESYSTPPKQHRSDRLDPRLGDCNDGLADIHTIDHSRGFLLLSARK